MVSAKSASGARGPRYGRVDTVELNNKFTHGDPRGCGGEYGDGDPYLGEGGEEGDFIEAEVATCIQSALQDECQEEDQDVYKPVEHQKKKPTKSK